MVDGFGLGSLLGFTRFQPQRPRKITLGPEESSVVRFNFEVPSTVSDGASFCTQAFVGQGDSPFFDTIKETFLFCISKGVTGGFAVLSEEEVKDLRRQVDGRSMILPKQQGLQK
jgi:hypothetical protein